MIEIGRVALVVVVSAVYFGLAVLGWGGLAPFFSHPARVALALVVCAMVGVALFAGGNVSAGVREDRRNRWVLAVFAVLGLLDGWLPAYTDRIGFWTIDGDVLRWAGVALFAAGGALRLGTRRAVGAASRYAGGGAHPRRRGVSALPIRRAIRRVPRAHVAADTGYLLSPSVRPSVRTS